MSTSTTDKFRVLTPGPALPAVRFNRGVDLLKSLAYPVILVACFAVLVLSGVSGTSSSVMATGLGGTSVRKANLLTGHPRTIRYDEWAVSTPLLLSQSKTGYPAESDRFPGGLNMTLIGDIPAHDWSTVFRPELWPFGFLPLDMAFAWRWWLLGLVMLVATYALALQLARSRILAVGLSVGLYLSPFVQWWHCEATLAWSTAGLALFHLLLGPRRAPAQWALRLGLGFVASAFALVLYPPFQIPCLLVTTFVAVGLLAEKRRNGDVRTLMSAGVTVLTVATLAAGVLALFYVTRASAILLVRGTVYPGSRHEGAGGFPLARLLQGFSDQVLQTDRGVPIGLGGNESEASGFVLIGLLLAGVQVVLLVRQWRSADLQSFAGIGVLAGWMILLLDMFVPVFGAVNQFFGLQYVPVFRLMIGLGLLSTIAVMVLIRDLRLSGLQIGEGLSALAAIGCVTVIGVAWVLIRDIEASFWPVVNASVVAALVAVIVYTLLRQMLPVATVAMIAMALWMGGPVNPLYRGVFDPSDSRVGQAIARLDAHRPGAWLSTAELGNQILTSAGVVTYSTVSPYPRFDTWAALDPAGRYRDVYNRYGSVHFRTSRGGALLMTPQADSIVVRLEPCGGFVQKRVRYVLADQTLSLPCLTRLLNVPSGHASFTIYEVMRRSAAQRPRRSANG